MIRLSLQTDFAELQRALGAVADPVARAKATAMALNKVGAKGRTTASREIRRHYAVKVADVNPKLQIVKASARGDLKVVIQPFVGSRGRSQNVIRFLEKSISMVTARRRRKAGTLARARQLKGGGTRLYPILHFQIMRGEAKRIHGAFIGNSGRTVFRRTGAARLPIEPVHTIDVADMFGARKVLVPVLERIEAELPVEVQRAIQQVLRAQR